MSSQAPAGNLKRAAGHFYFLAAIMGLLVVLSLFGGEATGPTLLGWIPPGVVLDGLLMLLVAIFYAVGRWLARGAWWAWLLGVALSSLLFWGALEPTVENPNGFGVALSIVFGSQLWLLLGKGTLRELVASWSPDPARPDGDSQSA